MSFRTIDLQPIDSCSIRKLSSLFNKDLVLKARQGNYGQLQTNANLLYQNIAQNIFGCLGAPIVVTLDGRAATYCLVKELKLLPPRDIDITFHFNTPQDISLFERQLLLAVQISLKTFFPQCPPTLLLKDCLWNFAKIIFPPSSKNAGGRMYLYSFGPERHKGFDLRVICGSFRGWVTLLDSFSIQLNQKEFLAGSMEMPLHLAVKCIENRSLNAMNPSEVLNGGFERYISALNEGFYDPSAESMTIFLAKLRPDQNVFNALNHYFELHCCEKGANFAFAMHYHALLSLRIMEIDFDETLARPFIEKLQVQGPLFVFLKYAFLNGSFDQMVSVFSLVASHAKEEGTKVLFGKRIFPLQLSQMCLAFPVIDLAVAERKFDGLRDQIFHHPFNFTIIYQLLKLVSHKKNQIFDPFVPNYLIDTIVKKNPLMAFLMLLQCSTVKPSHLFIAQMPSIYEHLREELKPKFIEMIQLFSFEEFSLFINAPKGFKLYLDLWDKGHVNIEWRNNQVVAKWLSLITLGEFISSEKIFSILRSSLSSQLIDNIRNQIFLRECQDHETHFFASLFNLKTIAYLIFQQDEIEALNCLYLNLDELENPKNKHIKFLFHNTLLMPHSLFLNPFRWLYLSRMQNPSFSLGEKEVCFVSLWNSSSLNLLIDKKDVKDIFNSFVSWPIKISNERVLRQLLNTSLSNYQEMMAWLPLGEIKPLVLALHGAKNQEVQLFSWQFVSLFKSSFSSKCHLKFALNLARALPDPCGKKILLGYIVDLLEDELSHELKVFFKENFDQSSSALNFRIHFLISAFTLSIQDPLYSSYPDEALELFTLFFKSKCSSRILSIRFKTALNFLYDHEPSVLLPAIFEYSSGFPIDDISSSLIKAFNSMGQKKDFLMHEKQFLSHFYHASNDYKVVFALFKILKSDKELSRNDYFLLHGAKLFLNSPSEKLNQYGALIIHEGFKANLFTKSSSFDSNATSLIALTVQHLDSVHKIEFSNLILDFLFKNRPHDFDLNGISVFCANLGEDQIEKWFFYFRSIKKIDLIESVENEYVKIKSASLNILKPLSFLQKQSTQEISPKERRFKNLHIEQLSLFYFSEGNPGKNLDKIRMVYSLLISWQPRNNSLLHFFENEGLNHILNDLEREPFKFFSEFPFLLELYKKSQSPSKKIFIKFLNSPLALNSLKIQAYQKDIKEHFGSDLEKKLFSKMRSNSEKNLSDQVMKCASQTLLVACLLTVLWWYKGL